MQTHFGSGTAWAVPMIDLAGNNVVVPTPIPFGAMQEISLDLAFAVKELYGMYQFPIDVARGTGKITGKSKVARFQSALFNQLFGETATANEMKVAYQESANVGANNFTVAMGGNWYLDLGVVYQSSGVALTRNTAAGAAGQYALDANNNGQYLFHTGDANLLMYVSYAYTANNANATGQIFTINNQLLGLSPFFKLVLNQVRRAKHLTVILNRCVSTKLTYGTKLEDFNIPEMDFSAMADDAGVVGKFSVSEIH